MLQTFRNAAKTWAAKIVIAALAVAFSLWGINDIFHGGVADTSVATVGKHKIEATEYDRELRAEVRNFSQTTHQNVTLGELRMAGIAQQMLDRMIDRVALDTESNALGLTASDAAVAVEIRSYRQFIGPDGAFSRPIFEQFLSASGYSETGFIEQIRQDIARAQFIDAVVDGLQTPPGLARVLFAYLNQTRTIEYILLTPADVGAVRAPTEAELAAFHKAHGTQFSSPEYREIQYVEISPEQVAGEIQVTDADLQQEYESNKDAYVKPEERDVEQINFPSQAAAEAAHQRIAAGTDFMAIVHEMRLKDEDVKLGAFAKSGLDPKLADAVFAVAEGGVTAPVQGPFGWVLLRAAKVTPGVSKTFDELKAALRDKLVKDRAKEHMIDIANKFEDARGRGLALPDATQSVGLTAQHIAALDDKGLTPEGTKASVPSAPTFLQQAFSAEVGEEGDMFQTDDQHAYAIKVIGVTPPAVKPLDQVRDAVREAWTAEERTKLLEQRTQTLMEEAKRDNNLAGAAGALGRAPITGAPLKRDAQSDVFSSALLAQLFGTAPGTIVSGPDGKGHGYVIARATAVQNISPAADPGAYENHKRQIASEMANDLVGSLAGAARATAGVTVNDAAVNRVFGNEAP